MNTDPGLFGPDVIYTGLFTTDADHRSCLRVAREQFPDLVPRLLALWPHLREDDRDPPVLPAAEPPRCTGLMET